MICPKGIVQSNILSLNYSTFRIFKTTLHDFMTLESYEKLFQHSEPIAWVS